jgi:spermidine synthase
VRGISVSSALLFLSGFAALVYQVLWMRDLAILFGNSAHAAAVDLAVFFGGLAIGAALFARIAPRVTNPLRVYGLLELGIAASALLFFGSLGMHEWLYAPLYRRFETAPAVLVAVKCVLAFSLLGPPTILMGATLPAMVQHRRGDSPWLYGVNTAGAMLGAFAAGFLLPPTLGFRGSYALAVGTNVLVGLSALLLHTQRRRDAETPRRSEPPAPVDTSRLGVSASLRMMQLSDARVCAIVAFASGALTIGLEVAWLRMFAQVLDNSVYAFSAVLVVALIAFALASLTVSRGVEADAAATWLPIALALGAIAVGLEPMAFTAFTNGLAQVHADGWAEYLRTIFLMAALFVGIPGFIVGVTFPALLRLVTSSTAPGATVGRLLFVNTAGAIAGSLGTTFLLLPRLGLWRVLASIAVAYALLAIWISMRDAARRRRGAVIAVATAAVVLAFVGASQPRIRLDGARGETVRGLWESSHGTVAVTESKDGLVLRMNNSYSLGGTVDRIERERIQTFIPLALHPAPSRAFYLGLGTGITAGEAVRHPVDRIVVCELVPEVVTAAKAHFGPWTRGLTTDPRVDIRTEDGRHYLSATGEQFDVIISDLFVPWHAGTGTLYTREHFEIVRSRLRAGGLFAQWLPLYQLSQRDFDVIARTLLDVFPHVVLWRGDFYAYRPIVALVASMTPMKLDPAQVLTRGRHLAPEMSDEEILAGVLPFYAGNLGAARSALADGDINTDERPLIEYLSPVTQWGSGAAGSSPWFVSIPLAEFFDRLRSVAPISSDPYLADLSPAEEAYVEAGAFYYRAVVHRLRDEDEAAERHLGEALQRLPKSVRVGGPFLAIEPLVQ